MKKLFYGTLDFMVGILVIVLMVGIPFLIGFMLLICLWNLFMG